MRTRRCGKYAPKMKLYASGLNFKSHVIQCLDVPFPEIYRKMLGQTKISNFFTSPTSKNNKRSLEATGNNSTSPKSKYQKSEDDDTRNTSSLSPEQKERMERKRLEALEKLTSRKGPAYIGMSWKKALYTEFEKDYFVKLNTFVESERKNKTVYPPGEEVFTWTKQCNIHEVKVVILGQDPYHGPRQAHGLCFSVKPGVAIPPSLVNIYKELESDIEGFRNPKHGYLIGWARQGVLLLNAVLTVVASQANSHKDKGWEKFTDAVIRWINTNLTGVVFMLWGAYAQKKGSFIDKNKHCVLKAVHPSPLSAHRGFLGCRHFSQANDYLKKKGKKAIDWTDLPLE